MNISSGNRSSVAENSMCLQERFSRPFDTTIQMRYLRLSLALYLVGTWSFFQLDNRYFLWF